MQHEAGTSSSKLGSPICWDIGFSKELKSLKHFESHCYILLSFIHGEQLSGSQTIPAMHDFRVSLLDVMFCWLAVEGHRFALYEECIEVYWSERYILVLILVYIFIDSHPPKEMEVREPESWDLSDSPRCCRPHPLDLTGHWAQVTIIPWCRILSHTNHMMTCRFTVCACDPWLGCSLGQIDLAWEVKRNYWNEICLSESSKYLHNNQYSHFHTLSAVMWAQDNSGFACLEPFSGWTRCDVLPWDQWIARILWYPNTSPSMPKLSDYPEASWCNLLNLAN